MERINIPGLTTYFGGKSGSGTYQTIINQVPKHDLFISLFAGNCGVCRNMIPSLATIVIDCDAAVTDKWMVADLPSSFTVLTADAISYLRNFKGSLLDNPTTVIYADPPYRFPSRKSQVPVYNFEFTEEQHKAFLSIIVQLSATVLISHYPDELYDTVLCSWRKLDFNSMTRSGLALERLYMNFPYSSQLHDYRYIGSDYRERELFKKLKNNLLRKLDRIPPVLRNSIISDLTSR